MLKGKIFLPFTIVFMGTSLLFSCVNSLEEVKTINATDQTPNESMKKVTLLYTDSGVPRATLRSPLINKYTGKKVYTEFPDGLQVDFFDKAGEKEARMDADYGIFYEAERILVVQNNVIFVNYKMKQTLYTEMLTWNQNMHPDSVIYTNKEVRITGDAAGTGKNGLFASQNFASYRLIKVRNASYEYEKDSLN
jgi:LPS export ABC transporter protein LptC